MHQDFLLLASDPVISQAFTLQLKILEEFHGRAATILKGHCALRAAAADDRDIRRNVFSTLFLASQRSIGLEGESLRLCGLISQCMRAWVTGCDNILDDEFKEVIPLDLPTGGTQFRSVLMIMVADRILTDLLLESSCDGNGLDLEQCQHLSHASLNVLVPSGIQEHEEEAGAADFLAPEAVLAVIHAAKTGMLFEAPLAIAEWFLGGPSDRSRKARSGLHAFGLACQILDDIVDAEGDFAGQRHNYVLSLAAQEQAPVSGVPVKREALAWDAFDIDGARLQACEHAAIRFEEARGELEEAGLRLQPRSWECLTRLIPALLRVPEDVRCRLTEATACITG